MRSPTRTSQSKIGNTNHENTKKDKKISRILACGMSDVKSRPPPGTQADAEKTQTIVDGSFTQLPASDNWLYVDPEYLFKPSAYGMEAGDLLALGLVFHA